MSHTNGAELRSTILGGTEEQSTIEQLSIWKKITAALVSRTFKRIIAGIFVLALVTIAWVGATQCLKATYVFDQTPGNLTNPSHVIYSAPFLTCWFCTLWTTLFFPLYVATNSICALLRRKPASPPVLQDSVTKFRDRGFTPAKFLSRCLLFTLLSVLTNYLYIASLARLQCTVVIALFATNITFVYLLSWVLLHDQFMGVRIVAVILCTTGIALLAYMDGVDPREGVSTLGAVVLASSAAAGSAVYKVMFKRVMGDVTFGQVSLFFSLIGLLDCVFLWPMVVVLWVTGAETVDLSSLPWAPLCGAAALSLAANLLANFSILITYENFITLGLVAAVPASAGYDSLVYQTDFRANPMKLAGLVIICCGFILVLTPNNWAELLRKLVRWGKKSKYPTSEGGQSRPDLRTGYIGSRLRSPSGRVR